MSWLWNRYFYIIEKVFSIIIFLKKLFNIKYDLKLLLIYLIKAYEYEKPFLKREKYLKICLKIRLKLAF